MPKRALVVLNGEPPSKPLLRHLCSDADLVVAADGGANVLHRYRLSPDVVIGDLDSIRPVTRKRFASAAFFHVPDQNSTDFEKALEFLKRIQIRDVVVAGATGRRIDFTLGNFVSLWKYLPRLRPTLVGDGWEGMPVVRRLDLSPPVGTTVSLIPFSRCTGVTLRGFRYPLRGATLSYGSLAVSNMSESRRCSISLRSGKLLAIVLR
ncbi:MAG: thiamine diphosphokinase [Pseudomonadota bacterium]